MRNATLKSLAAMGVLAAASALYWALVLSVVDLPWGLQGEAFWRRAMNVYLMGTASLGLLTATAAALVAWRRKP